MLVSKDDFIGLQGIAHLGCGGQPPLLKAHQKAFEAFAFDKSIGMDGYERHWEVGREVKSRLAAMTGLTAQDFALLGNASEGIVRVVSSLNWTAGDNAVVSSLDYASGRLALAGLARMGIETRYVDPKGWFICTKDLIDACDDNTRVVYISQVNAHTGQQIELSLISEELRQRGILLLVDVSHALGVVPVDGTLCDFLVCSTYKFLLSPHSGILAWNRCRWPQFEPTAIGWNSANPAERPGSYTWAPDARRAEIGNPNHLAVYLLRTSLEYLAAVSAADLERHVHSMTEGLSEELLRLDFDVITPASETQRGPNVSFASSQPRQFVAEAARNGIILWGEDGRVRASVHAFVTNDDLDRFLDFAAKQCTYTKGTDC